MICAAARFARSDPQARVVVVGAVDEERHSAGSRYLVDRMRPDAVMIGEPGGSSCVGVGHKGNLRFSVGVSVSAAHTSSPAAGAVEVAAEPWATAQERFARWNLRHGGPALFDQAVDVEADGQLAGHLDDGLVDVAAEADQRGQFLRELPTGEHRVTVSEHMPAVRSVRTDRGPRAERRDPRERRTAGAQAQAGHRRSDRGRPRLGRTEFRAAVDVPASPLPRQASAVSEPALGEFARAEPARASGPGRTGGTSCPRPTTSGRRPSSPRGSAWRSGRSCGN
ncbi:M20/M25/M40 family metallo-hydrolase [Streptomyces olivochromogenes]|uniref:M20/M25/M40 family metallo-hydrolase n=1 Tax=Streptomyces olivochromogenes TaxID=1963 RepID=UPI00099E465D